MSIRGCNDAIYYRCINLWIKKIIVNDNTEANIVTGISSKPNGNPVWVGGEAVTPLSVGPDLMVNASILLFLK